jgi:hypothetical protein
MDDDLLVNVPRLMDNLNKRLFPRGASGHINSELKINHRDITDKHYIPYDVYRDQDLKPFPRGWFYVLTSDVLEILYQTAYTQTSMAVLILDDEYVIGMVADSIGIPRYDTKEAVFFNYYWFHNWLDTNCGTNPCDMFHLSVYDGCDQGQGMRELYYSWKSLDKDKDCLQVDIIRILFAVCLIISTIKTILIFIYSLRINNSPFIINRKLKV